MTRPNGELIKLFYPNYLFRKKGLISIYFGRGFSRRRSWATFYILRSGVTSVLVLLVSSTTLGGLRFAFETLGRCPFFPDRAVVVGGGA